MSQGCGCRKCKCAEGNKLSKKLWWQKINYYLQNLFVKSKRLR